jgi:hypothetical protein
VLGLDGKIRSCYIADDGQVFFINEHLRAEMHRYLVFRFKLSGNSLRPLLSQRLDEPLFRTQKSKHFSANTLAQHFSLLDKSLWQRFESHKSVKRNSLLERIKLTFTSVT